MNTPERVRLSAQSSGLCWIEALQPELSMEMLGDLLLAFDKARQLNDVKAVVLVAQRLQSPSYRDLRLILQKERLLADFMDLGRTVGRALREFKVPMCLCVSREVSGFGLELLLHAPFSVCGEDARVGWGLGHIPLLPAWGTFGPLLDRLGPEKALDLLFRRDLLTAREALDLGLVQRTAPDLFLEEMVAWQVRQSPTERPLRRPNPVLGKVLEPLRWVRSRSRMPEEVREPVREILRAWGRGQWDDMLEDGVIRGYMLRETVCNRLLFAVTHRTVQDESRTPEADEAPPERLLVVGLLPPGPALARAALDAGIRLRIVDRDWQAMQKALGGLAPGGRLSTSVRFSGFSRYPIILETLSREHGRSCCTGSPWM